MRTLGSSILLMLTCAAMCRAQDGAGSVVPPSRAHEFQLGVNAQRNGNVDLAIQKYRNIVNQLPTFVPAWFNMGLALDQKGDSVDALHCFKEAMRHEPQYPNVHLFIGIEDVKLANPLQAVPFLDDATQENPGDKQGWFWLARAHLLLHHADLAMKAAKEANRVSPNDPSVEFLVAEVYIEAQDWQEGEEVLRGLVTTYPNLPHLHEALAEAYYLQARVDEALAEYKKDLAIDPQSLKDRAMIGVILCDRGAYADAIPYLSAVSQKNAAVPVVQLKLAEALWHKGEIRQALPHAQAAAKLAPGNPTTHFILWKVYAASGQSALATKELKSFRSLLRK